MAARCTGSLSIRGILDGKPLLLGWLHPLAGKSLSFSRTRFKVLGNALDKSLLKYLKQLGWASFQKRQTVLEVQQVTTDELRHGISYGAMFYAVHSVPVKVWPQRRR